MKFLKKIGLILACSFLLFSCKNKNSIKTLESPLYQTNFNPEKVDADTKTKIESIMLMNQVLFSICKITESADKSLAGEELNFLLNKIDKYKLISDDVFKTYDTLLKTLAQIELNDDQKAFLELQTNRKKKAAIYNIFNSFGSVFVPGQDPYQMAASFAYTGFSAFLNYKRTVSEIDNNSYEKMFKLEEDEKSKIDNLKRQFWGDYRNLIINCNFSETEKQFEVSLEAMDNLVHDIWTSKNADRRISNMELRKDTFKYFSPFWFELGAAYQEIGDYSKAKECYSVFELQKQQYSIINHDPYYTALAKNMILILLKENPKSDISKYVDIIKNDIVTNEKLSENYYYLGNLYFSLGDYKTAKEYLTYAINGEGGYSNAARQLNVLISLSENNDNDGYLAMKTFMGLKEHYKKGLVWDDYGVEASENVIVQFNFEDATSIEGNIFYSDKINPFKESFMLNATLPELQGKMITYIFNSPECNEEKNIREAIKMLNENGVNASTENIDVKTFGNLLREHLTKSKQKVSEGYYGDYQTFYNKAVKAYMQKNYLGNIHCCSFSGFFILDIQQDSVIFYEFDENGAIKTESKKMSEVFK